LFFLTLSETTWNFDLPKVGLKVRLFLSNVNCTYLSLFLKVARFIGIGHILYPTNFNSII